MQKKKNKTNGFDLKLQYSSIFIAACLFMNTFLSVLANLRSWGAFVCTCVLCMAHQEQPNLHTRLDDAFLLRFLRARKFDYDRALQLLLNYHAGRRAWPEVFQDLKPSTVKHVLDLGFLTVLPRPDPSGRYILCLRPGGSLLSSWRIQQFLKYILKIPEH